MNAQRLKKYCVFKGQEWIDIIRIYAIPCDGMIRYLVRHMEEEDMWIFDSVEEALEFVKREFVDKLYLKIGECP